MNALLTDHQKQLVKAMLERMRRGEESWRPALLPQNRIESNAPVYATDATDRSATAKLRPG